ncbi:MAG TPA: type II toxin-antitoxin system HicA family toxin [Luteolibacter sp.]|nr:type II toxin-antitoxin system HicA family toxin [Luteolibacter sp.]
MRFSAMAFTSDFISPIRLGFSDVRQTVSHRIMRKDGRTVVVPMHRPIKPGTLKGLVEQAGLTMEDFVAVL